jgi:NitT/TauT family transport system substrate-binding protein
MAPRPSGGAMTRAALIQWALLAASAGTASAADPDLTPVRFIASVADAVRPFLYAQSAGLFHQAGLDVDWQQAATGAVVAQSIAGGAKDIGMASITSIIAAYARNLPFAIVAPSIAYRKDNPTAGIVVSAGSPLRAPLDLQGKVVSCSAIGDIAYLGLRALIDKAGGDSSTVKFIELPPTAVVTAAIVAGRIDAGLIAEPAMMEDVRAGKLRFFVDELTGYSRPILEVVYFSTREYAAKNRDTVARFAKVLERASIYSNAHVAETSPLLATYAGMDPKVTAEMRHGYMAPTVDPGAIQPVVDLMAKYKNIPQAFDAHELLSTVVP